MAASNYDDVLGQLRDAGLVIPPREGLRIGTHKPVRCFTEDDPREKRGWYLLKEWSPSVDRMLIVGSFGIVAGAVVSAALMLLAHSQSVPVAFDATAAIGCGILVLTIALVSGAMAVRTIAHLEPANLLR